MGANFRGKSEKGLKIDNLRAHLALNDMHAHDVIDTRTRDLLCY